jgi:phospholipase C
MSDPFKHVVLLMLENHSFDQMLGCMTDVYPHLEGVRPNAPNVNRDDQGREYPQHPHVRLQMKPDPKHESANALGQLKGGNGGFIKDYLGVYGEKARDACPDIMGYFPRGSLPALHVLAEQFTICDHWFSSLPGPTWPNRFFALSGTSNGRVLMPDGVKQLGMLWTQTQDTIFDRINQRNERVKEEKISWHVYFYDFPSSLILRHQRRPENLANYRRINRFFEEARGPEADFPNFAFIEPKYFGIDQNDDHPPHNIMKAQKLIADVYNAIRSSPDLWASTLLVVVYDEHGGFYDHVEPPAATPPDSHHEEYSFDRLGVRVPALLISPHMSAGVVSTPLEHTSLLRYLMRKWGLDPLGARTMGDGDPLGASLPGVASFRNDTIPFIRVPGSQLVPSEPDWERQDVGVHHQGLHLMADVLDLPDEATEAVVAEVARVADSFERGLPRLRAAMGDTLIAMGRALRHPLEEAQKGRIDKSAAAVRRLLGEDGDG